MLFCTIKWQIKVTIALLALMSSPRIIMHIMHYVCQLYKQFRLCKNDFFGCMCLFANIFIVKRFLRERVNSARHNGASVLHCWLGWQSPAELPNCLFVASASKAPLSFTMLSTLAPPRWKMLCQLIRNGKNPADDIRSDGNQRLQFPKTFAAPEEK